MVVPHSGVFAIINIVLMHLYDQDRPHIHLVLFGCPLCADTLGASPKVAILQGEVQSPAWRIIDWHWVA